MREKTGGLPEKKTVRKEKRTPDEGEKEKNENKNEEG